MLNVFYDLMCTSWNKLISKYNSNNSQTVSCEDKQTSRHSEMYTLLTLHLTADY